MNQANDLMIGNWVNLEGVNLKLDTRTLYVILKGYSIDLKPIRLTEEVLLKCPQFKQEFVDKGTPDEVMYFSLDLFPDNKYNDLALLSGDKNGKLEVYLFPYDDVRFEYLHQIQNVVFTLTGKELEVKG